jgi:hypothetical protein
MIQLPTPESRTTGSVSTELNEPDWYYNDWFVVSMTVFLLPIGVYLAIKRPEPYPWKKFFIVFGALVIIGYINDPSGSTTYSSSNEIYQDAWDNSVPSVERYLKHQYLRDPESYESIKWGKLEHLENGNYEVIHSYRARNGFGGMAKETKIFTLSPEGEVIYVQ